MIELSTAQIIGYIFKDVSEEEDKMITELLSTNEDYHEAILGLIDFCSKSELTREQLQDYLLKFKGEHIFLVDSSGSKKNQNKAISFTNRTLQFAASILFFSAIIGLAMFCNRLNESQNQLRMIVSENKLLKDSLTELTFRNHNGATSTKVPFDSISNLREQIIVQTKKAKEYRLIATATIPNAELEARRTSWLTERATVPLSIYPKSYQNFKKGTPIVFRWGNQINPGKFILLNNTGEIIYSKSQPISPLRILTNLNPGLYYWQLESNRDVLVIDRFVVSINE